jgi:hypothetical protein
MSVRKGAGFWLWKPFIIRHALSQAQEGDAVIYTDAGMIVVGDPALLLGVTRDHPVVLFRSGTGQPQRTLTKRDCFVLLDADAPEYWDTPQLLGGIQLYRAGPEASAFVDKLCAAMPNVNVLTDAPNICGLPNLPEFLDHRHDQAILTIMAQKEGIPIFPQPTQWGRPDFSSDVPFGQVFQLHGKKDLDVLGWYFRWLTGLPVRGPTQTKPR